MISYGKYLLLALWLGITVLFTVAALREDRGGPGLYGAAGMSVSFAGLFATIAVVVRLFILRDERALVRLVRDGTATPARVLDHVRTSGGLQVLRLVWTEGVEERCARFEIDNPRLDELGEVTILAIPDLPAVAADLGEQGVVVGQRARG